MIAPCALAEEREMVDEGPGYKNVSEAVESGPACPQPDRQQNRANEIREERNQERGMRPYSDGVGKVCHELRPVCRLLFQAVPQEQRRSCRDPQQRESGLCPLGNKAHQQDILYSSHFNSSGHERTSLPQTLM